MPIICRCACANKRQCHARKSGATKEGAIADARHAVGDCHTRKPGATIEGTLANACHAVGDCHARKPGATIEGIIADARHAVGNLYYCVFSYVVCDTNSIIAYFILKIRKVYPRCV